MKKSNERIFGLTKAEIIDIADKLAYTNYEGVYFGPSSGRAATERDPNEYTKYLETMRKGHEMLMAHKPYMDSLKRVFGPKTIGAT